MKNRKFEGKNPTSASSCCRPFRQCLGKRASRKTRCTARSSASSLAKYDRDAGPPEKMKSFSCRRSVYPPGKIDMKIIKNNKFRKEIFKIYHTNLSPRASVCGNLNEYVGFRQVEWGIGDLQRMNFKQLFLEYCLNRWPIAISSFAFKNSVRLAAIKIFFSWKK